MLWYKLVGRHRSCYNANSALSTPSLSYVIAVLSAALLLQQMPYADAALASNDTSTHLSSVVHTNNGGGGGNSNRLKNHSNSQSRATTLTKLPVPLPSASGGKSSQEMVAVSLPGDIILGGLFPVHEKGEGTPCGPKVYNRGVHRLEAMLYAIDRLNADDQLLPGITIGVHILDTCSRDTYALNQSLQFVRASLNNLDTTAFECPNNAEPRLRDNASSGPVFGVIGGSYSSVSLQVANLLRLFHIPQISPASTAKTLSDKSRFDLFARTVPPDTFQSVALVDIIKCFNWSYVSTIHSEGSYGEYGIEAFHKEATERNVCIAAAEKVPSAADDKVFDAIIGKLQKKPNARGVILFTRAEDARRILLAAKRANLVHPFHWIASDGWGKQQKLLEGLEDIAEGAITVELQSEFIEDFDRYMMELTPESNTRNPWFAEYWEDTFNCVLTNNYDINNDSKEQQVLAPVEEVNGYGVATTAKPHLSICDNNYRLNEKVGYEQESKTQFVVDAVYAFAHALHKLHKDLCLPAGGSQSDQSAQPPPQRHHHSESIWFRKPVGSHSLACPAMTNYDGKDFYNNYLLNVSFIDLAGSEVKFDRQGDGLARYDILNYQRLKNSSGYHYKVVGKWFNKLELQFPAVVWNKASEMPVSACSLPCDVGMIKKQQGDTCCWICDNCEPYEYVYDEFTCRDCGNGNWPYSDKLSCYPLEIQYVSWTSVLALISMTIAILGIVTTVIVIVLFIMNHDTPLVRASGRELSYTLLIGILVCFFNTFPLIAKPTIYSCVAQRFGIGVGFSIIYSALLTKTNRISRIFHSASKSAQRVTYISPQSQVLITASLISFQVLITVIWMIVDPPGTRFYYPDRSHVILKCKIQDNSFLFSQLYNMILITVCTVYAIKTRKIPENFNESKFIGFTMYTTCIIWLAFIPIYFSTGNSFEIQITTLSISISLSGTVALVCLYSPKIHILVFHPDKNVRKLTMNSTVYRRSAAAGGGGGNTGGGGHGGALTTGAASSTSGCRTPAIGAPHISISVEVGGGSSSVLAAVKTLDRAVSINGSNQQQHHEKSPSSSFSSPSYPPPPASVEINSANTNKDIMDGIIFTTTGVLNANTVAMDDPTVRFTVTTTTVASVDNSDNGSGSDNNEFPPNAPAALLTSSPIAAMGGGDDLCVGHNSGGSSIDIDGSLSSCFSAELAVCTTNAIRHCHNATSSSPPPQTAEASLAMQQLRPSNVISTTVGIYECDDGVAMTTSHTIYADTDVNVTYPSKYE